MKEFSRITRGSIICSDVSINPHIVIPESSRVSLYKYDLTENKYVRSVEATELGQGFIFDRKFDGELSEGLSDKKIQGQCIGGPFYWLESDEESSASESSSDEDIIIVQKGMTKERNFLIRIC